MFRFAQHDNGQAGDHWAHVTR